MEHGLELIQFYPGNRWKFDFYDSLISWKYWKSSFFLISHILEILETNHFNNPNLEKLKINSDLLNKLSQF